MKTSRPVECYVQGSLADMKERMQSGGGSRETKVSGRSSSQTHIWRLPSGKLLAEFALEAGFLAPRLAPLFQAQISLAPDAEKKAERP
jgi:hypothetical protein